MSAQEDPQITSGRMIFKANCQKCHPNGDADFGPAIRKMNLPRFVIKVRVRSRGFMFWMGKMPSFNKHEISKKDLDDVVEYVKFMQNEYKKEQKKN
jgi:mono/diheme cytochrome c family protein